MVSAPFVYKSGLLFSQQPFSYFRFIPVNMVMAKAKTVAQAQNLCCFMEHTSLQVQLCPFVFIISS